MKSDLPHEIAASSAEVQRHYLKCIADGQSPRFAEMVALMQPPGVQGTDSKFMEGRNSGEWLNAMPKRQANFIVREAKAAGIDVSGKYYHSGLADRRGWCDPEAWISGKDDLIRVAKKRKLQVTGQVNYTPPEAGESRRVGLAKDIVASLAKQEMAKNPSLTKRQAAAIVREKHTPRWAKGRKAGNK
jgi:hypothetical protein